MRKEGKERAKKEGQEIRQKGKTVWTTGRVHKALKEIKNKIFWTL